MGPDSRSPVAENNWTKYKETLTIPGDYVDDFIELILGSAAFSIYWAFPVCTLLISQDQYSLTIDWDLIASFEGLLCARYFHRHHLILVFVQGHGAGEWECRIKSRCPGSFCRSSLLPQVRKQFSQFLPVSFNFLRYMPGENLKKNQVYELNLLIQFRGLWKGLCLISRDKGWWHGDLHYPKPKSSSCLSLDA